MAQRTLTDKNGRPYALLSELREGHRIELDHGFDCVKRETDAPTTRTVLRDESNGKLYFACASGKHYLDGQIDDSLNTDTVIGIYRVHNGCTHEG